MLKFIINNYQWLIAIFIAVLTLFSGYHIYFIQKKRKNRPIQTIGGQQIVKGNQKIKGSQKVEGNQCIGGNQDIED
ncbi:hypothetical protein KKF32_04775 [Patescibacteria group bacterium]|nr:hypothetical protein [Patescibacteria group bacterium]